MTKLIIATEDREPEVSFELIPLQDENKLELWARGKTESGVETVNVVAVLNVSSGGKISISRPEILGPIKELHLNANRQITERKTARLSLKESIDGSA